MLVNKNMIDRNLLTHDNVEEMIDYLNTKMVTDVTYSALEDTNELGITTTNLMFTVKTLHMGLGEQKYYFTMGNMIKHNADVLIENIMDACK